MPVLLIIRLKEIVYSGENIGRDLSFRFDVQGQITPVKTRISSGQHKSFNKVLFQEAFPESFVSLPINVAITEKDPAFPDLEWKSRVLYWSDQGVADIQGQTYQSKGNYWRKDSVIPQG